MTKNCSCDGAHAPGQGKCGDNCLCKKIPIKPEGAIPDHKAGNPGIGDAPVEQKFVVINGDHWVRLNT